MIRETISQPYRRELPTVPIVGSLLTVALVWVACVSDAQEQSAVRVLGHLRLDVRPFERPTSTYVKIENQRVVWVTYSPHLFTVTATGERGLDPSELSRLEVALNTQDVSLALRRGGNASVGLTRGDLAQLWVGDLGWSGFLADAPAGIQVLVRTLLAFVRAQESTVMAPAYARTTPIESLRLARIRERGTMRVTSITDHSPRMQEFMRMGFDRHFDFLPLDLDRYQELAAIVSHGKELFVVDGAQGYQIALFLAVEDE